MAAPSPALPTLLTALARLTTAAHILNGLAHRNRNQHRPTKWWAPFSMLRRSVRKILPDLEAAVRRAEVVSSSSRKQEKKSAADRQPELDRVVERVLWLKSAVMARAYVASTQLTADKQFAQLGLVLIGVLADVDAATAPFAPAEPDDDDDDDSAVRREVLMPPRLQSTTTTTKIAPNEGLSPPPDDLGVAVSRDEVDGGGGGGGGESIVDASSSRGKPHMKTAPPPETGRKNHKERKKLRGREGFDDTVSSKPESSKGRKRPREKDRLGPPVVNDAGESRASRDDGDAKKPKKKRRKGDGDEFDDLFSSLM